MDVVDPPKPEKEPRDLFRNPDGSINYTALRDLSLPARYIVPSDFSLPIVAMVCTNCGRALQAAAQMYARFLKEGFSDHEAVVRLEAWMRQDSFGMNVADCCLGRVPAGVKGDVTVLQNTYFNWQYESMRKQENLAAITAKSNSMFVIPALPPPPQLSSPSAPTPTPSQFPSTSKQAHTKRVTSSPKSGVNATAQPKKQYVKKKGVIPKKGNATVQ